MTSQGATLRVYTDPVLYGHFLSIPPSFFDFFLSPLEKKHGLKGLYKNQQFDFPLTRKLFRLIWRFIFSAVGVVSGMLV